jgi:DNA excision repair protein ERCC-2
MAVKITERFAYGSFRPGQKELAERVYAACQGGETLLAEATSGFGKTAAILSGSLSAAEDLGYRVLYACRTKRQIERVIEEAALLQKKHPVKATSVSSKHDYCLLRRGRNVPKDSFSWFCGFHVSNNLCSYFLNVPLVGERFGSEVERVLEHAGPLTGLLERCESIHVCPYEVIRLAMAQALVTVTPYHYVFDPRAAAVLFDRGSLEKKRTILVVDEAHNLRDFCRSLGTSTLTLDMLEGARKEAEALYMSDVSLSLGVLRSTLGGLMKEAQGWLMEKAAVLSRFSSERGEAWLQDLAFELVACSGAAWGAVALERRMPSLILKVGEFLERLSSDGPSVLVHWGGTIGLVDPDPVRHLGNEFRGFAATVMLSATVSPSALFVRSLGMSPSEVSTYSALQEHRVVVRTAIDTGVSTRYSSRGPEMFLKISERVAAAAESSHGGVGVFVPSYSVMEAIRSNLSEILTGRHIVSEAPGLGWEEAGEVFDSFLSAPDSVLLAVQGGRYSEGEDFRQGTMRTVVVVGLCLPPPSPILFAEYSSLKQAGEEESFLMLSRMPALRKAFQAAGRHVRAPGKRGLVFLLDERFGVTQAIDFMPSWLKSDLTLGDFTPQKVRLFSNQFWGVRDE